MDKWLINNNKKNSNSCKSWKTFQNLINVGRQNFDSFLHQSRHCGHFLNFFSAKFSKKMINVRPLIRLQGLEKSPKLINIGPTFIPDCRVLDTSKEIEGKQSLPSNHFKGLSMIVRRNQKADGLGFTPTAAVDVISSYNNHGNGIQCLQLHAGFIDVLN